MCAKWQWNARDCVTGLHHRRSHLKGRYMVTVWRTVLLLSGCYCDSTHQHYDVTQFEYVLWRHTMHEWVMNIHYKTWIAQGRFTNMILTPSKQWGMCDNKYVTTSNYFVLNSLDKGHINSVCTHYVCDESENARVCAKWQWNALDWCYWIALSALPGVQSSNTVSCVSLSFRTHSCVLALETS